MIRAFVQSDAFKAVCLISLAVLAGVVAGFTAAAVGVLWEAATAPGVLP